MSPRPILYLALLSLPLFGCQKYDVRVNDRLVYSPTPLFGDYDIADPALRRCVERAVNDQKVTAAAGLTHLDCSRAGIESLAGLAVFPALASLRLSANQVRNLVELNAFDALEELYLDDNRVVDPVPLYALPALRQVDLSGNDELQCPHAGGFRAAVTVTLPAHCR